MRDVMKKLRTTITVASTSVALVLGLMQLYSWLDEQSTDVRVEVSFGEWKQIPTLKGLFVSYLHSDSERETLQSFMNRFVDSTVAKTQKDSTLGDRVRRSLSDFTRLKTFETLQDRFLRSRGYVKIRIVNEYEANVDEVKIVVPYAIVAAVTRVGKDVEVEHIEKNVFMLGRLSPREVVGIYVWTEATYSNYTAEEIKLTFSKGSGVLRVYTRPSYFFVWLSGHWGDIVWYTFLLMLVLSLLQFLGRNALINGLSAKKKKTK